MYRDLTKGSISKGLILFSLDLSGALDGGGGALFDPNR